MINVCPIGRNCSKAERDQFEEYDNTAQVRKTFVEKLKAEFADLSLRFSIGGQISFDVFPEGWDKSFCLKFIEQHYDEIHFWGDKTAPVSPLSNLFYAIRVLTQTYDREVTITKFTKMHAPLAMLSPIQKKPLRSLMKHSDSNDIAH